MGDTRKVQIYLSMVDQNDAAIVAAALVEAGKLGLTDLDGNFNRSAVVQTLIREHKAQLQAQPSPIDGVSMWQYLKDGVKAAGKLPWPDKEKVDGKEKAVS